MEVITHNLCNQNHSLLGGFEIYNKMSSLVPFTFDTVELCVVTLNDKLRSRAKEAWKVPKYNKKTADVTEKTTLKNIN